MTAEAAAPAPRRACPGPENPGWEDLRRAAVAAVRLVALEVQGLRHALPTDDQRIEAAQRASEVLEAMTSRLENIVLDEVLLAEREARAYAEGLAAGAAGRRCGPHRNPGNLRAVTEA